MAVRRGVQELVDAGPVPSEDADAEVIAEAERLLERVVAPVTDHEAQCLVLAFGDDDCYGLAWTLLHLIETAPGAQTAKYSVNGDNMWVTLLNARVEFARKIQQEQSPRRG